jgi:hypothetical protein
MRSKSMQDMYEMKEAAPIGAASFCSKVPDQRWITIRSVVTKEPTDTRKR